MKPPVFAYHRPDTLDEALATLADAGDEGRALAGGQSLIPLLNLRMARPDVVVDLGRLRELDYIRVDNGWLRVGAMTRQRTLELDATAAEHAPLLRAATRWIGHQQIRTRGTVGGSIAHADPAAELPVAALALGAEMVVRGPVGERICPATQFFGGFFGTAVEPGEILVEVRFPRLGSRCAFVEVARRHGDFAIAGVGVAMDLGPDGRISRAGVALAGVGPAPLKVAPAEALLRGEQPSPELFEAAAQAAAEAAQPSSDIHGSASFRLHLVRVLTTRALSQALAAPAPDLPPV
ncbi:MAG: aerobic carbon-monoxide dehydrogenase medium subunit [Gaiellales bacterium]|nr:aerobic carbon-monoxide dehydrogenase medium subunit [Gaiellales bacterium]MEA2247708.1 aerobic carbon-monoxide dehydrogenase medium subunit [Solirubrobacteraceae bacterium]